MKIAAKIKVNGMLTKDIFNFVMVFDSQFENWLYKFISEEKMLQVLEELESLEGALWFFKIDKIKDMTRLWDILKKINEKYPQKTRELLTILEMIVYRSGRVYFIDDTGREVKDWPDASIDSNTRFHFRLMVGAGNMMDAPLGNILAWDKNLLPPITLYYRVFIPEPSEKAIVEAKLTELKQTEDGTYEVLPPLDLTGFENLTKEQKNKRPLEWAWQYHPYYHWGEKKKERDDPSKFRGDIQRYAKVVSLFEEVNQVNLNLGYHDKPGWWNQEGWVEYIFSFLFSKEGENIEEVLERLKSNGTVASPVCSGEQYLTFKKRWPVFFGEALGNPVTNEGKIPQTFTGGNRLKRFYLWSVQAQGDKFLFRPAKFHRNRFKFIKKFSDTVGVPKLTFFFQGFEFRDSSFHSVLSPFIELSFRFRHCPGSNNSSSLMPKVFKNYRQIPATFRLPQGDIPIIFGFQDKGIGSKTNFFDFSGVNPVFSDMQNRIIIPYNFFYQGFTSGISIIGNTKDVKRKVVTTASPLRSNLSATSSPVAEQLIEALEAAFARKNPRREELNKIAEEFRKIARAKAIVLTGPKIDDVYLAEQFTRIERERAFLECLLENIEQHSQNKIALVVRLENRTKQSRRNYVELTVNGTGAGFFNKNGEPISIEQALVWGQSKGIGGKAGLCLPLSVGYRARFTLIKIPGETAIIRSMQHQMRKEGNYFSGTQFAYSASNTKRYGISITGYFYNNNDIDEWQDELITELIERLNGSSSPVAIGPLSLQQDIRPAYFASIISFIKSHPWYIEAYYSPDNPSPLTGCKSFSFMVGKDMISDGIDVRMRWSILIDHFYLSALGILEDGSSKEIIIDYAADQTDKGSISPLVGTRDSVKNRFPDIYHVYWPEESRVLRLEDIRMDNWYREYALIYDLAHSIRKNKYSASPLTVEERQG